MPLYGDMQIAPFNYVMRTKNYEASKWPACNSQSESIQGKILEQVDRIRNEHTNYISELAKYSNEVDIFLFYFTVIVGFKFLFVDDTIKKKRTIHYYVIIKIKLLNFHF